jgi:ATP synthase protein I
MTKPDGDGLGEHARQMQAAQPWINAVWKLLGATVVGVGGGFLVERFLPVKPWGVVIGSVLGISLGFYAFIREAMRLGKR